MLSFQLSLQDFETEMTLFSTIVSSLTRKNTFALRTFLVCGTAPSRLAPLEVRFFQIANEILYLNLRNLSPQSPLQLPAGVLAGL
jgi:hypothetical protein